MIIVIKKFEKLTKLTDTIGYNKWKYKIRLTNNIINFDYYNKPLEFHQKIKDNDIKLEEVEKNRNT